MIINSKKLVDILEATGQFDCGLNLDLQGFYQDTASLALMSDTFTPEHYNMQINGYAATYGITREAAVINILRMNDHKHLWYNREPFNK